MLSEILEYLYALKAKAKAQAHSAYRQKSISMFYFCVQKFCTSGGPHFCCFPIHTYIEGKRPIHRPGAIVQDKHTQTHMGVG